MFGGIAYPITNLTEQPQIWILTVSVFIGGVVLVVQFIVEFDERIRTMERLQMEHYTKMEDSLRAEFKKINEATELFSVVEDSTLRTDGITELVRNATKIKQADSQSEQQADLQLVSDLAQSEIGRLSEFLKELGDGGTVSYDGEDREWLLALTRHIKSSLDATSLPAVDGGGQGFHGGFWFSDLGERYLDIQREIVRNGVCVRRVFILDGTSVVADDPEFKQMCRIQRDIGIHVRVLDPTELVTQPHAMLFDFVLFDEKISYEITPAVANDRNHPVFINTRLILQKARVRERVRGFNALWDSAKELEW
ncbi:hypothetical protein ACFQ07_31665 [Actinomadura adrarensis]|uniref:Uncharacterized protein n=1 Tax=Actinomadura adrarensis TaxID=1819600 RepID=A0ABW3CT88_9ACTN